VSVRSVTYVRGRFEQVITVGAEPGPVLRVSPLGARVVSLTVPVGEERREVTCGVEDEAFRRTPHFLGATVGRYANRIARGDLPVEGDRHQLATQETGHTLHGGPDGFDQRTWEVLETSADHVVLALDSPDGDQGFPGRVRATVRYDVRPDGLVVTLGATTDAATYVCLTNHTYFSLGAPGDGDVRDHRLQVLADRFLPVDADLIPTGEVADVVGTPFDLRTLTRLGDVVADDHPQLVDGLDHNYVLDGDATQVRLVSPTGDLTLELTTDQPGVQVYTGQGLEEVVVPGARPDYPAFAGIALEPQVFPDSPHHPEWPSGLLRPGEEYRHVTTWRFVTA
jgi:aldose 1-epimerase